MSGSTERIKVTILATDIKFVTIRDMKRMAKNETTQTDHVHVFSPEDPSDRDSQRDEVCRCGASRCKFIDRRTKRRCAEAAVTYIKDNCYAHGGRVHEF